LRYSAEKKFYQFEDPFLLPIIIAFVGIIGNVAVFIGKRVLKERTKRRKEEKNERSKHANLIYFLLILNSTRDIS